MWTIQKLSRCHLCTEVLSSAGPATYFNIVFFKQIDGLLHQTFRKGKGWFLAIDCLLNVKMILDGYIFARKEYTPFQVGRGSKCVGFLKQKFILEPFWMHYRLSVFLHVLDVLMWCLPGETPCGHFCDLMTASHCVICMLPEHIV